MKSDTREDILTILTANPHGLTIVEIARKVDITRQTASKYLDALHDEDLVHRRQVGQAKLHYPLDGPNPGEVER